MTEEKRKGKRGAIKTIIISVSSTVIGISLIAMFATPVKNIITDSLVGIPIRLGNVEDEQKCINLVIEENIRDIEKNNDAIRRLQNSDLQKAKKIDAIYELLLSIKYNTSYDSTDDF
jgi:hypothetical protein